MPLQPYGDKQRRLRFAAEQKERDWRCCVFADEKTFVCNPRPNRRNDVIWTDDPSTIEPHSACCPLSPSTPSVLSLHRANRLSSFFFLRILLHRSTSRSLNPLCCQQREIGSVANTGPMYKTAIRSTAKLTQDWLRTNVPEYITRKQWPPRSPDLNPIENAWALVPRQASLRQPKNARGVETCSACGVDGGDDGGVLYHSG